MPATVTSQIDTKMDQKEIIYGHLYFKMKRKKDTNTNFTHFTIAFNQRQV